MKNMDMKLVSAPVFAEKIAKEHYFMLGYNSYYDNKPFNYDIADHAAALAYTRGRHFAAASKYYKLPKTRFSKNTISKAGLDRLVQVTTAGCIL